MGSAPSVLSIVRLTSARPSGGRDDVPAKITSSILPPRSVFAPCSPMTHARASTTLDFPDPLGPTTQVIPGSKRSVVADAKDLNPRKVRVFKYTVARSPPRSPTLSLSSVPCLGECMARFRDAVALPFMGQGAVCDRMSVDPRQRRTLRGGRSVLAPITRRGAGRQNRVGRRRGDRKRPLLPLRHTGMAATGIIRSAARTWCVGNVGRNMIFQDYGKGFPGKTWLIPRERKIFTVLCGFPRFRGRQEI